MLWLLEKLGILQKLFDNLRAVVVVELAEQLLPLHETWGSNQAIVKFCFLPTVFM